MISTIIVAAGLSERFGTDKLSAQLGGIPLLMRTLFAFEVSSQVDEIILVVHKSRLEEFSPLQNSFKKIVKIVAGGETRQQSSILGVLEAKGDICLVHNGANPLVTQQEITAVIQATEKHGAAFVGRKVSATIRKVHNGKGVETLDRSELIEVETPQGFQKTLFLKAINSSLGGERRFTDEIGILETIGVQAHFVEASPHNKKITTSYDLQCAEAFLKPHTRMGIGHDSHSFQVKSPIPSTRDEVRSQNTQEELTTFITLGGIQIPHSRSFEANSDGDVVIHALCNAIGTAIGEGSLSRYADEMCKQGITDSMQYLDHIKTNMLASGYALGNIAISIEGKEPKLEAHIKEMKKCLADALSINAFQIGIACTSGEGLTSFGRGEGLQCFCSVQLIKV